MSDKPKHHLDKRAADLIAGGAGDPDELLDTKEVAAWFRVSEQWLETGRSRSRRGGYGPPFVKLGRMVRYKRSRTLAYLAERERASTSAIENKLWRSADSKSR